MEALSLSRSESLKDTLGPLRAAKQSLVMASPACILPFYLDAP